MPERFTIAKTDDERRIVFGWASVAVRKDGTLVVDTQGDTVDPTALEDAAYDHVLRFREANADTHFTESRGDMVESFVATPDKLEKMGLAKDALPLGWWVGYRMDEPTYANVKGGKYTMFSVEGSATRRTV